MAEREWVNVSFRKYFTAAAIAQRRTAIGRSGERVDPRTVRERLVAMLVFAGRGSAEQLTDGITINRKLGIDGDDAYDLMLAIMTEFEIPNLSDFEYDSYFGGEGLDLRELWRSVFGNGRRYSPLTIGNLVSYIERKIAER